MIDFNELDEIVFLIQKLYGYDFSGYSRASLLRRVNRFMDNLRLKNFYELRFELVNNPEKLTMFIDQIVVNVSEFFRDPVFYRTLWEKVIPYLNSYPRINIWSAGCSYGEESYSLAILLKEQNILQKSRIYATDLSSAALAKAKIGAYSDKNMFDYAENYYLSGGKKTFDEYFTKEKDCAVIKPDLKENILFSRHNLVTDGVFKECQLILCRNVLIYFNEDLQDKVLNLFYESLSLHGFLALGSKESIRFSSYADKFEEIDRVNRIFKKIR